MGIPSMVMVQQDTPPRMRSIAIRIDLDLTLLAPAGGSRSENELSIHNSIILFASSSGTTIEACTLKASAYRWKAQPRATRNSLPYSL